MNKKTPTDTEKGRFTFADLFAGIGGFRIAFESVGGTCVFSSEWDKLAAQTYEANFGEVPAGDITQILAKDIPDHDILTGGFPCQPFSIAGVTKHTALGNAHGFDHATQGTLFFDVARIIGEKKPRAFLIENVKNLLSHDKGRTFATIRQTLEDELKYHVYPVLLDARSVVPQHRERIFLIGFRDDLDFDLPPLPDLQPKFRDILEPNPDAKYTLTDHLWKYLQDYAEKHRAKGNGFQFGMTNLDGVSRTLSARYYKDGSEILIPQGKGKNPRRLTPRECARLMGFPEEYKIVGSDTRAYKQFGNSVVVPVVQHVAREMVRVLFDETGRVRMRPRPTRQLALTL
jgi:DNA (cytosine-5)-methyltransferase 1